MRSRSTATGFAYCAQALSASPARSMMGPTRAISTRLPRVGLDHLNHSRFGLGAAELHVESQELHTSTSVAMTTAVSRRSLDARRRPASSGWKTLLAQSR